MRAARHDRPHGAVGGLSCLSAPVGRSPLACNCRADGAGDQRPQPRRDAADHRCPHAPHTAAGMRAGPRHVPRACLRAPRGPSLTPTPPTTPTTRGCGVRSSRARQSGGARHRSAACAWIAARRTMRHRRSLAWTRAPAAPRSRRGRETFQRARARRHETRALRVFERGRSAAWRAGASRFGARALGGIPRGRSVVWRLGAHPSPLGQRALWPLPERGDLRQPTLSVRRGALVRVRGR